MIEVKKSKGPEILLALLQKQKHVRELLAEVGGSALTLEMRIEELLKEKLIEEEPSEAWPRRRVLKLTGRGREMAMLLKRERDLLAPPRIRAEKAKGKGKWLLALLRAVGGTIEGNTRLQKLCFLLKHEFGVSELPYDFSPYYYGPFSLDVDDDALGLETTGFIKVERGVVEPALYTLTQKGNDAAEEIYGNILKKDVFSKIEKFNEMKLIDLLNYVYTKYPRESRP